MPAKKRSKLHDRMIAEANYLFRNSENDKADARRVVQSFVTGLLIDAGVYRGFRYITPAETKPGVTYGILFDESEARAHTYQDQTRVELY